jgi:predicted PurR-regulated permease PerM
MVGRTFLAVVDMTSLAILVPLYVFVMLLYSNLLVAFVLRLASGWQAGVVKATLVEARAVVNKYMIGLMMETAIVAVLNSGALLLLGIDYAVLFGVLAAILNLIPYVGILIGGLLPMIMAIVTKDSLWYPIGVLGAFTLIQFIDNNLIIPYVVASRVSINALISIVAVIIGGMLWGVSGMFLALPAVAILKVIFDRVEHLAPWGLLLGDTIPAKQRNIRPGKRP